MIPIMFYDQHRIKEISRYTRILTSKRRRRRRRSRSRFNHNVCLKLHDKNSKTNDKNTLH